MGGLEWPYRPRMWSVLGVLFCVMFLVGFLCTIIRAANLTCAQYFPDADRFACIFSDKYQVTRSGK